MKHFGSRLLDLALSVLAAVLVLLWAWSLVRPLLPAVVVVVLALCAASLLIHRRRYW